MKIGSTGIAIITSGLLITSSNVLADEGWKFRLAPYMWFAGLEGDVGP